MVLGCRFGSAGLKLSSFNQWQPIAYGPNARHDGFPPLTIETAYTHVDRLRIRGALRRLMPITRPQGQYGAMGSVRRAGR